MSTLPYRVINKQIGATTCAETSECLINECIIEGKGQQQVIKSRRRFATAGQELRQLRRGVIILLVLVIGFIGFLAFHYLMTGQVPLALCTQCH